MIENSYTIHGIFAFLFVLYILIDRAYIRIFIQEEKRTTFYKKAKWIMLLICTVLVISGTILLIEYFSILRVLKLFVGLFLIVSFFYCPVFMKNESSSIKRFMYRYFVVILTVIVVALGLYM